MAKARALHTPVSMECEDCHETLWPVYYPEYAICKVCQARKFINVRSSDGGNVPQLPADPRGLSRSFEYDTSGIPVEQQEP
jgi:hypothetical protein